jgi:hypothetical protein
MLSLALRATLSRSFAMPTRKSEVRMVTRARAFVIGTDLE